MHFYCIVSTNISSKTLHFLPDLKAEIKAANKKVMDVFAAQDAVGMSKLYTEDCKLMPAGMDVQCGREGETLPN